MDAIRTTIMRAWARLDRSAPRRRADPPQAGRPRDQGTVVPRAPTSSGTNCRSWLFTICRNTHLHERQRASTRHEVMETDTQRQDSASSSRSFMDQRAVATGSPDDFFETIVDEALVALIDSLPGNFREVIVLSDLGDLTYPEIAEVLGIPVGTVKSRLFRARAQVRDALMQRDMDLSTGAAQ
jgi:RNA polymerase sigma-70 factor (ECF subfamily)